jgi:hypothetical protein
MVLLLLWPIAGVAFVLWRWISLGREQSSVAAYEASLRHLEVAAQRGATAKRRPSNPMPGGHVRVLPRQTAVLRPKRKTRKKRSAGEGRRLGMSA